MSNPSNRAAIEKGKKLVHLYRRGVGGERKNAGRLLIQHLKRCDLTLYDLDSSLPVSQELSALDHWRESAALLQKLGTTEQEKALMQLVDADDLTSDEMERLLEIVDLQALSQARLSGWIHTIADGSTRAHNTNNTNKDDIESYHDAARQVQATHLQSLEGSLSQRLREAILREHYKLNHPERLIRSSHECEQYFIASLARELSGHPAQIVQDGGGQDSGVRAYLSVEQLARLRALLQNHKNTAQKRARQAIQDLATELTR